VRRLRRPRLRLPDCDCGGCDLLFLRVSTLLAVVALVVPACTGGLVAAAIRGYRRWLTRFTPSCPSEPSCSAYALAAVQTLGARRGLRAATHRVRACGARAGHQSPEGYFRTQPPSMRPTMSST
jgi:putative component of membrane protein insertase Oxa1/YidC/SpoIIIJ protein YidD